MSFMDSWTGRCSARHMAAFVLYESSALAGAVLYNLLKTTVNVQMLKDGKLNIMETVKRTCGDTGNRITESRLSLNNV